MSDKAIDHMRRVRQQIARINEKDWDLDTRVTLETLCDTLIEILQSGGTMDRRVMAKKFIGIMNQLIHILQDWQSKMTSFRNFVGDKVKDAKSVQSRGNQSQVIWTGMDQEIVFLYARLYCNVCMSIIHSSIIIIRTLWFHCHKHSQ